MGSEPRTSDAGGSDDTRLGRAITERMRPRLVLAGGGRHHSRPGHLLRSTRSFGMRLGLSQQNRHRIDAATLSSSPTVRPPADYWPWPDPDEQIDDFRATARRAQPVAPQAPKTAVQRQAEKQVDALRRFIAGKGARALGGEPSMPTTSPTPAAAAAAPSSSTADAPAPAPDRRGRVRRGLPLTPRRNGRTWAGPRTSPGGMATGAAPQATNSVAHSRWGSDAPEPLPDVVASGIFDNIATPRGSRAATARPASRDDQFRRMLERTGQVPPSTVSAESLAGSLSRGDDAAQPQRPRPVAQPAASRPGGTLSRVLADDADGSRGAPDSPDAGRRSPPSSARPAAPSASSTAAGRGASTQPVSAEMLRRITTPSVPPSGSGTSSAPNALLPTASPGSVGPRPGPAGPTTRGAQSSGADADLNQHQNQHDVRGAATSGAVEEWGGHRPGTATDVAADAPMIGLRSGSHTVDPLGGGARALPLVTTSPSAIAVMERVQRVTTDVSVADEAVLPPRSFAGWDPEPMPVEQIEPQRATLPAPLPLATVRRRHQSAPATAPATAPAAPAHRTDEPESRAAAGSPASLVGTVPAESVAATAARIARTLSARTTTPAATLPLAAASPRRHRRAIARSLDGRSVQWAAEAADVHVGGTDLNGATRARSARSAVAARDATSPRPAQTDVVHRPVVDQPGVHRPVVDQLGVDRPVVDRAVVGRPVIDRPAAGPAPTGASDHPTERHEAAPAAEVLRGNDAQLRRALLATDRALPLADQLAVAPPMFGQVEAAPTADADETRSPATDGALPITSDVIHRAMQQRSADVRVPATEHISPTSSAERPAPTPAAPAGLPTATSRLEAADRLVDVDAASVTAARPFLDRGTRTPVDDASVTRSADIAAPPSSGPRPLPASAEIRRTIDVGPGTGPTAPAATVPAATVPAATVSPAAAAAAATAASSDQRVARAPASDVRGDPGRASPARWVPADPGTLFSKLSGRGVLQRRSLLTLSEASIAAASGWMHPGVASPDALLRRAVIADDGHRAVVDPDGTRPSVVREGRVDARRADEPAHDAGRSPAREAGREPATLDPAPTTARRGSRAEEPARPLVDPAEMAVAPRAVQRSSDPLGEAPPVATAGLAPATPRTGSSRRDPTNGAARVAAVDLADRFLAELSRHRQERPKPLPTQFASIAEMIVAGRRPMVSTGEASQRALAAVNKVAATTGDVIHIAEPHRLTSPDSAMRGIIAHELTHVASPSPAPRFFGDDRHTDEEHRATEIGELMRRSPAPPSGSGTARGGSTPMSIARDTTRSARRETSGTIRRELVDTSSPGSVAELRDRFNSGASNGSNSSSSNSSSNSNTSSSAASTQAQADPAPGLTADQFTTMLRDNFDLIVELLEDRIITDIERRGGRFRGDF